MSKQQWDEQQWDDLGKGIASIIESAINNRDFQQMSRKIRQTVADSFVSDPDFQQASQTFRQAVNTTTRKIRDAGKTVSDFARSNPPTPADKPAPPELYANTGGLTAGGVVKVTLGGVLLAFSLLGLLASGLTGLFSLNLAGFIALPGVLGLIAGVLLLNSGVDGLQRVQRYKVYRRVLGDKTYCSIRQLASAVGKSMSFVRRDLKRMIRRGLFLEGYLDNEEMGLITSHETYRLYEKSRRELEARTNQAASVQPDDPTPPQAQPPETAAGAEPAPQTDARVQEVLARGQAFLAQIRHCNDRIPGDEISEKIARIEVLVQRIFSRAQAHPEVIPDLKKLMDYYLPMTVKLLDAYADMDAQPVQGPTIRGSKREIEKTLDTLNLAYEKLLDGMFQDTALDVSSDITVLQTLLAQEGLTEDALSQMKNQN